MISQVLKYFFSASDIMEAVRGHFCFYAMNARLCDSSYIAAQQAMTYLQYNSVDISVVI